jgi:hypothetical protein
MLIWREMVACSTHGTAMLRNTFCIAKFQSLFRIPVLFFEYKPIRTMAGQIIECWLKGR